MRVGTAREIINPEVGHLLAGYGIYANEGIHDDISVTALFLNDGENSAFLLNFDVIGMRTPFVDSIRQAISEKTGVAADHVVLACTHTHSGPEIREPKAGDAPNKFQPKYNQGLTQKAVAAAVAAKASAEDCELYFNFSFSNENMNRRYNFPDRRFQYIPQNKQLAGLSSEYVDRELGIIAFRKTGTMNRYKALITVYGAHPLCVGNSSVLVTADYQGYLRKAVEETFGGCMCLSMTGCAGDQHPLLPESGFTMAEKMGNNLAQLAIGRCYDAIHIDYDSKIRAGYQTIGLPAKDQHTNELLPEARDRDRLRDLNPDGVKEQAVNIALLGIGPILLVGAPGEPVSELGAMIRWSSPFLKTYVLFQSTGSAGYIPTSNQYMWGGYEPGVSRFAQGAGEKWVQNVVSGAHELIKKQPLRFPVRKPEVIGY